MSWEVVLRKVSGALNIIVFGWKDLLKVARLAVKVGFGCVTLLLMLCFCAVPLALVSPDDETPTAESRAHEITLRAKGTEPEQEPIKVPTEEPQATYTDQPTSTLQPTHTICQ